MQLLHPPYRRLPKPAPALVAADEDEDEDVDAGIVEEQGAAEDGAALLGPHETRMAKATTPRRPNLREPQHPQLSLRT